MPAAVLEFLGAIGAQALKPIERVLSFANTILFSNFLIVGLNRARKKSQEPGAPVVSGTTTVSIRQPISPWQIVIGQRRVGGVITFVFLTSDKKYLHMVVTLACHVSEEIGDVQLDDETITSGMLDGSGIVTSGKFSRLLPTYFQELQTVSSGTITANHTIVSGTLQLSTQPDADGFSAPLPYVSFVGNTITVDASLNGYTVVVGYYSNIAQPVTRIEKSLGGEAGQPFADLVAESESKWTDAHRQTGHTKLYLRFDTSILQGSVPNISAVVKGLKLYDPRSGLTTWSANPALAINAFLTNAEFGLGAAQSEIGSSELIAAANVCDESVSLAAGGSELRYRANGGFLASDRPVDVLQELLLAMAGTLSQVSDTWRLFAGAYEAATLTLTEKDFAGPVKIEPFPSRDRWANGAKGVFTDPNSSWQPTDFPALVPTSTYLVEDNSETIYADLDFTQYVTSSGQAQRLARILVRQARSGTTVRAAFKLSAMQAFTGHSVALTFAKYGWSAKEFTLVDFGFVILDGGGAPALGVQLGLRETNSAIFSWAAEDQAQPTPPHSSLPNPFSVAAPGAPAIVESLYQTTGSAGVKSRATVSWTAVPDPLVKSYEVGFKRLSASDFVIVPVPTGTQLAIDDLLPDFYLFEVRALNGIVSSAWSPSTMQELHGLTDPPSDPTGFSIVASNGFAIGRWDLCPDLDVRIGGRAIVRWSPLTTGAVWENGILIAGTIDDPGFPGDSIGSQPMSLKTGTYLLKFRDSSGNYSTTAASFVATDGLVTGLSTLVTIQEDATFTGAKTDVVLNGSSIQIASVNLLQRTEEIDNAAWSKTNVTVTANNTTAPDGNLTADKIAATASAATSLSQNSITINASSLTYSVYAKKGSGTTDANRFGVFDNTASANLIFIAIDFDAKSFSYISGSTGASIQDVGGGWLRIVMTAAITSGHAFSVYAGFTGSAETASEFCYAWGAQLEAGSSASAYDKLVSTRIGNIVMPLGGYVFSSTDDRGSIAMRRFEGHVKALAFDAGVPIDSMTDPIDTWGLIDGGSVNDCNAQLLASVSDDNITFGPFTPFQVADFKGRYSKFRLDLSAGLPSHNIQVSELRVAIKA